MAPPPATAVADAMSAPGRPRESQTNVDIMAVTKGFHWPWMIALLFAVSGVGMAAAALVYQTYVGLGVAGYQAPVFWGVYIITFVFWIGIGHAGTLISAILFLFRAKWRNAINRGAETMTVFAVLTAALFPLIHIGRLWKFYFLLPYPNQRYLWVNFKSPLLWDVFAVNTYLTISVLFFIVGLIPDIAIARDRAVGWKKAVYALLAGGWQGTGKQWKAHNRTVLHLSGIATPLVLSVHSIVSWDFAMSIVPGLHQTIFAPYFVVGAIYSGTAGIVTVMYFLRKYMGFERYITQLHFDNLGKLLLVLSLLWTYINMLELFTGWYSGTSTEYEQLKYKLFGFYAPLYWEMILFCAVAPLLLISKRFRTSFVPMLILSIAINIGMYTERFLIISTTLSRQYLPETWRIYVPSLVEISIIVGSVAMFVTLFLLFVKIFPSISIYEVKETMPMPKKQTRPDQGDPEWQPTQ